MKDQIFPVWGNLLAMLDGLMIKAQSHEKGEALLAAKLAEDMHPLATQIRFVCNMPGEAFERMTGEGFTSRDDDPANLTEARAFIAAAREQVGEWENATLPAPDSAVELAIPNGMIFDMSASEYLRDWHIPQFYFHAMTAYTILRKEGLDIGKADYVPHMMQYLRAS